MRAAEFGHVQALTALLEGTKDVNLSGLNKNQLILNLFIMFYMALIN